MSGKSFVNGGGESYSGVVPTKQPNKSERSPAEGVEGRPLAKENTQESHSCRTPSRVSEPTGLARVREAAKQDKKLQFTALLHHVNIDLLRDSYRGLKKRAAACLRSKLQPVDRKPGVDEVTWKEYGENLEDRLADLHRRVHRGVYHAKRRGAGFRAPGRSRTISGAVAGTAGQIRARTTPRQDAPD